MEKNVGNVVMTYQNSFSQNYYSSTATVSDTFPQCVFKIPAIYIQKEYVPLFSRKMTKREMKHYCICFYMMIGGIIWSFYGSFIKLSCFILLPPLIILMIFLYFELIYFFDTVIEEESWR